MAKKPNGTPGGWKPAERLIFRFWDGQQEVAADPLVIQRKLAAATDLEKDIELAFVQSPEAIPAANEAFEHLVKQIREAFGVKAFSEGGLLDAECLELLGVFGGFIGEIKKKANPSPTCWKPTVQPPSPNPSPTPTGSGSISIVPASSADAASAS